MDLKEITTQSKIPTIKVLQAAQKLTKNRKEKVREWRKWWNTSGPMVRTLILNDSNNDDDDSDDDNNDDGHGHKESIGACSPQEGSK